MALNDIILYVDGAETTKARIAFAAALAKDHGAHLIGVSFAPTRSCLCTASMLVSPT